MVYYINEQSENNIQIYYGLTEKEAKQKRLIYKGNKNFTIKGVNTSLKGLKKFIHDQEMENLITKYTIVDSSNFEIDDSVYPDKEYDMIAVKIPFSFDITNVHDLR